MRIVLITLAVTAAFAVGAEESRFNPSHSGSYLGIRIDETREGIRVEHLMEDGAALRAGLQEDDLITGISTWNFADSQQEFVAFLKNTPPEKTTIRVLRDDTELDLQITPDPAIVITAREIARHITGHRLFRRLKGAELKQLEEKLVNSVRETQTRERAYEAMNTIIGSFNLSHTAVITPWVKENLFGKGDHFHLGINIQKANTGDRQRYFIRSMMFGSPVREAGLKIGDEIISVNNIAFKKSPRRTLAGYEAHRNIHTIQVDRNETVSISYRRTSNVQVKTLTISVKAPLDAVTSLKRSIRVINPEGQFPIGYLHLWNVMSGELPGLVQEALRKELKDTKALAIDLRGRGGQVNVIARIARVLAREKRPIALLIDREARSAKEMLAYRMQKYRHITLVGETTAGAVLPARFIDLSGGAQLMLPVSLGDAVIRSFTSGKRLEGLGAAPDIKIPSPLPYRAGRDPILDGAVIFLRDQASGRLLKI
jgi:C-terminal processing protease CtpA/Prc